MSGTGADTRALRVLAILPWVASQPDGVPIADLCARFGIDEPMLLRDLETVSLVGVPPFTPDTYVGVSVEGGRVWVEYPQWFDRPLRLTPEQGLALVAAGHSLQALHGAEPDGPLARATAKIAGVLGIEPGAGIDVRLGDASEEILSQLRLAVEDHRQVRMRYYAFGRQRETDRVVDPLRLFAEDGEWYLAGHCHQAEALRLFRVDRMRAVEVTDTRFAAPAEMPDIVVFDPDAGSPRIAVDLAPGARWVAERYPVESVEERGDGVLRVRVVVASRGWIERLLVRLGPDATVVEADDDLASAGAAAAARVLARYASGTG